MIVLWSLLTRYGHLVFFKTFKFLLFIYSFTIPDAVSLVSLRGSQVVCFHPSHLISNIVITFFFFPRPYLWSIIFSILNSWSFAFLMIFVADSCLLTGFSLFFVSAGSFLFEPLFFSLSPELSLPELPPSPSLSLPPVHFSFY